MNRTHPRTRIAGRIAGLSAFSLLAVGASSGLVASCTSSDSSGCDRTVGPSSDDYATVQQMFEDAQDGETLCLSPGTYTFADGLAFRDHTGVTIRGTGATRDDVVLDFSDLATAKGITVMAATDFTIENMTLLDAPGDNLFIGGSTNVTIRGVRSGWENRSPAGRYALYPVESTNVLIEDSEAFGSADAGIYVGQTTNCIVRNSRATANVAGIEIENSTNCEVTGNTAEDNTGGILVFELPGLALHGSGTLVHDNIIRGNNRANFGEAGTTVALVPDGTGVMLLAANDVEVRDNTVENNGSTGLLAISYTTAVAVGAAASTDDTFDPYNEGIYIHDNTFTGNGTDPASLWSTVLAGVNPLEDIIYDGTAGRDLAQDAVFCVGGTATFRNLDFANNLLGMTTELGDNACTMTERDPVTLPQDSGT